MGSLNFSFDQNQLDKIVEKLEKKEPKRHFSIDKFLNVIQVIAIVISGCWIFYRYKAHEELSATLNNQSLVLQNESIQLQNRLHQEIDSSTIKLSQLDVQKANQDFMLKEIDLQYKEKIALIEYNSKKIDYESQLINLKYAQALKDLEKEHDVLQNKQDNLAYSKSIDNRYETLVEFKCRLVDTIRKVYLGNIKLEIKNVSDTTFNVSAAVVGVYLSKFRTPYSNSSAMNADVLSVNYPPDMYNNGGDLTWKLVQQKGYVCWDCDYEFERKLKSWLNPSLSTVVKAGALTGRLKSGSKVFSNFSFYFSSDIENIVGVNLEVIFNSSFSDSYHFESYKVLKYLQFPPDNL